MMITSQAPIGIDSFSGLIGTLYQGLEDDIPWKQFLRQLQDTMGAKFATFILRPPSHELDGLILSTGRPTQDAMASYNKHFYALDPFVGVPSGHVVTLDEFIPEHERESSEFFRLYLAPLDVYHIVGTDIITPDGATCSLRISRGQDGAPFAADDKALLKMFIPHIERAVKIHMQLNRIETERKLYAGAVDQLAVGTIILDEKGKVLQTNQVAQELLADKDGLKLVNGTLQVGSSRDTLTFRQMIKHATEALHHHRPGVVEALRIQRASGASDLGIVVRSIPSADWNEGKQQPAVVLFVSDPDRKSRAPQEVVKALFDFTPAESHLAMLLANGLTLDEASEELSISRNTARAHLRSIFSKTGVTRQTMLVRLILRSVATLG
ncbi:helix-turn-helix transcriptional regulator [Ferrimonas pelagia]|uniref:HTH luxR-type domain-containing protein n=1 Tax=Ferrimonas pelagia TaxID=1177826 RepID=A0ABP9ERK3_9GAMM